VEGNGFKDCDEEEVVAVVVGCCGTTTTSVEEKGLEEVEGEESVGGG